MVMTLGFKLILSGIVAFVFALMLASGDVDNNDTGSAIIGGLIVLSFVLVMTGIWFT